MTHSNETFSFTIPAKFQLRSIHFNHYTSMFQVCLAALEHKNQHDLDLTIHGAGPTIDDAIQFAVDDLPAELGREEKRQEARGKLKNAAEVFNENQTNRQVKKARDLDGFDLDLSDLGDL